MAALASNSVWAGAMKPYSASGPQTSYRLVVTLQHGDFKDCVVPTWRISDKEPTDLKKAPANPADAKWKFSD